MTYSRSHRGSERSHDQQKIKSSTSSSQRITPTHRAPLQSASIVRDRLRNTIVERQKVKSLPDREAKEAAERQAKEQAEQEAKMRQDLEDAITYFERDGGFYSLDDRKVNPTVSAGDNKRLIEKGGFKRVSKPANFSTGDCRKIDCSTPRWSADVLFCADKHNRNQTTTKAALDSAEPLIGAVCQENRASLSIAFVAITLGITLPLLAVFACGVKRRRARTQPSQDNVQAETDDTPYTPVPNEGTERRPGMC